MIGKIEFPDGITWQQRYVTGSDFLGSGYKTPTAQRFYQYARSSAIYINWDSSDTTDMSYMFYETSFGRIYGLDTSNAVNLSHMFDNADIEIVPELQTSNVTDMSYMFYFGGGSYLYEIPEMDMSNVTNVSNMFYYCPGLVKIPNLNCSKVTSFSGFTYQTTKLESMGIIDCDSCTNVSGIMNSSMSKLTYLGGFRNLGKASNVSNTGGTAFLNYAPNLTYESVMNVLNLLYDRASAGLSVLTLKLHANHMAMLNEDDILVATNKGWVLA